MLYEDGKRLFINCPLTPLPNMHNAERPWSEINQWQRVGGSNARSSVFILGVFLYKRGNRAVVTVAAISGKGDSSDLTLTTTGKNKQTLMQLESPRRAHVFTIGLIWIKIFIRIHMAINSYMFFLYWVVKEYVQLKLHKYCHKHMMKINVSPH